MVRPLYPLRPKPSKPKPPPAPPIWKNMHLISVVAIVMVVAVVFLIHTRNRRKMVDPGAIPGAQQQEAGGLLSFINRSRYFKKSPTDIQGQSIQQLARLGMSTDSVALSQPIEAKNLREKRRIMAIQKQVAAREAGDRREREREELMERLSTPTTQQLKEAITGLDSSDALGIMRLERLLEDRLLRQGGDVRDLDALIFAYDVLANAYVERGMPERARDAYVNAFRLKKNRAPAEQGPEWEKALTAVEQMKLPSRNY